MSYETEAAKINRKPLTIVNLKMDNGTPAVGQTVLHLKFDDAAGSQTVTDSTGLNTASQTDGTWSISALNSKAGNSANMTSAQIKFPYVGTNLQLPPGFSEHLCFEAWVNIPASGGGVIFTSRGISNYPDYELGITRSTRRLYLNSTSTVIISDVADVVPNDVLCHVAISCEHYIDTPNHMWTLRAYINGDLVKISTTNAFYNGTAASSPAFRVGNYPASSVPDVDTDFAFIGYLDEVRITKGNPRYTGATTGTVSLSDEADYFICSGNSPLGMTFEPCIKSVDYASTKITESGLGYRGQVTITCQDFKIPGETGTYFGRMLGKNPFWLDRKLEVYRGFESSTFDFANFKKALYFIKKIDGPDDRGVVKITATDILTKLDGDQGVVPEFTNGNLVSSVGASYLGAIDVGDNTNFTPVLLPYGYAIIDSEIVKYDNVTGVGSITLLERGCFGSEAVAHDVDAPVRKINAAENQNAVDVILLYLLSLGIGSEYIDAAEWEAMRDDYLSSDNVTVVITEPTPIKDIVSSLAKQTMCAIWFDEETQKIRIKPIGPTLAPSKQISTINHILDSGHKITRDQSKAVTQVWVYYDKIDHSSGDSVENFRSIYVYADLELEGSTRYNTPKIEKVYAGYLPAGGTATASKIANRTVSQRKYGKEQCYFRLDVQDATLSVGDAVEITSDLQQGSDGVPMARIWMVIERTRRDSYVEYVAEATGIEIGSRYAAVSPNGISNYTTATTEQKSKYGFISNGSGLMSNGDAAYKIA